MSKKFLAIHEDGTLSLHSELSQDLIAAYFKGYVDMIKIENDTVYRPDFDFDDDGLCLGQQWILMENDVFY